MQDSDSNSAADIRRQGDFLQTLERGLMVIKTFDRNHAQMTLSDVSRRAGLTRAASRRILHTLVSLGYARTDGKLFELSPRVLELGYAYLSSFDIAEVARTGMDAVTRELGESCSMGVIDRAELIYVARVAPHRIMEQSLGIGARLPAYPTAMGQVLLAAMPDADLADLLERVPLARLTPHTVTDTAAYLRKIEDVRRFGYSLVDEELELGLRSIAIPIHDRRNRVIAAMDVSAHAGRMSAEQMIQKALPALRVAVHDAERPIGHL